MVSRSTTEAKVEVEAVRDNIKNELEILSSESEEDDFVDDIYLEDEDDEEDGESSEFGDDEED